MVVKFIRLSSTCKVPAYASAGAAGADLHADIDMTIRPGETRLIPTNIAVEIPTGLEGQIRPRSGLAFKNRITVLNSPGTIDSDYRGGIGVLLHNTGIDFFQVKQGDRIAQLVIAPYFRADFVETGCVSETGRGTGAYGSTGVSGNLCKEIAGLGGYNRMVEGS